MKRLWQTEIVAKQSRRPDSSPYTLEKSGSKNSSPVVKRHITVTPVR